MGGFDRGEQAASYVDAESVDRRVVEGHDENPVAQFGLNDVVRQFGIHYPCLRVLAFDLDESWDNPVTLTIPLRIDELLTEN
jgi:hypothetical protein